MSFDNSKIIKWVLKVSSMINKFIYNVNKLISQVSILYFKCLQFP